MNKKLMIGFAVVLALFAISFVAVNAQLNSSTTVDPNSPQPAPSSYNYTFPNGDHSASFASHCMVNGREIPCEELAHSVGRFVGWGIGGILVFALLMLLMTIFWIMMLVHVIKYPIEHKAVWILILLLTGILGAIVYYFAVKKSYNNVAVPMPSAPTPPPSTPPLQ